MFIGGEVGTRDRVLRTISERGPITAAELADSLGLTPAAVRRHLDCLAHDELVEEHEPTGAAERKRGRPARAFVVSAVGHARLRGDYDSLAGSVLQFLRDTAGDDAVTEFARQRADAMAQQARPIVESAGADLDDRTQALADALTEQGFAATTRPVGNDTPLAGVQLCQGHCPVQHVATEFPQFCEEEAKAFSRTLGVHVQRLSSLAHGDHVCTTFVPTAAKQTSPRRREV
ncbi:metalloregulator ArsR/SmtB family transcription factor [Flexivirga oryzae]|uniref:Putative ArsR family transcriptional regulator n=1 Tax=Flexivirga oryzae TaxID=1794944 RepID=A0A839N5W5_9MICO|nr:putative ArsR family transcriptional regulator [Flexivirga oryzae]